MMIDVTDEAVALAGLHEAIRTYNRTRAGAPGWHQIRISNESLLSQSSTLELDGRPLLGVRKLTLDLEVGGINRVTLELDAVVDIDLPADIAAQLDPCPFPHDSRLIPAVEDLVDVTAPDEDAVSLNLAGGSTGSYPDPACACGAPLLSCLTLQGAGRGRCCDACVHG